MGTSKGDLAARRNLTLWGNSCQEAHGRTAQDITEGLERTNRHVAYCYASTRRSAFASPHRRNRRHTCCTPSGTNVFRERSAIGRVALLRRPLAFSEFASAVVYHESSRCKIGGQGWPSYRNFRVH